MKIGKIPESVLVRSVLRQINTKREEVVIGARIGEDCAVIKLDEGEVFVVSTDPITGTIKDIGALAVHVTVNDIASSGAEPVALLLTILLPPKTNEQELKVMMQQVDETCESLNIQVIGGHTEVTAAVNQPIISITGMGKIKADKLILTSGARPGQDIVVTKWVGLEGTSIIAKEKYNELLNRYPQYLIDTSKDFDKLISIVPEAIIASSMGATSMHDITEGGIFGALWEMSESSEVGLEVTLKSIPIRQETVEICEAYGLSPYQLISSGSLLITIDNGNNLVRELQRQGIPATVIGNVKSGNDRVILNGEERRFLERPQTDELYKISTKKSDNAEG